MNSNYLDNSEDLLGKYLAQETDAQETALVEKWLEEKEEHRKELEDYTFIWDKVADLKDDSQQPVNVDAAWMKVKSKMDLPKQGNVIAFTQPKKTIFTSIRIAAGITILLTTALLAYFFTQKEAGIISLKTTQNTLEKTLPDGSKVFLNTNTTLNYPADFEGDTREISMTGEAFFNIQRNEYKPFIIHANGSDIKVLGTSFNIKAYNKNVQVSVETGKVQFKNKARTTLLVKGEQAEFEAENDTIKKLFAIDKNVFAYKTKVFVFENSSLEHIAKVLGEGYHTNILLTNNRIKSCRLTTKFDNETLPNALNIIAETLNLRLTSQGEKYVLDGEGCE